LEKSGGHKKECETLKRSGGHKRECKTLERSGGHKRNVKHHEYCTNIETCMYAYISGTDVLMINVPHKQTWMHFYFLVQEFNTQLQVTNLQLAAMNTLFFVKKE